MRLTPPPSTLSSATQTPKSGEFRTDAQSPFGVRVADIAAINHEGKIVIGQRKIPMTEQFDHAFAAFGQGTLFQSPAGFIAVEDLHPGDQVTTADGTTEDVVWIGSATFSPTDQGDRMTLTRIMADSFGMNRPETFVSLGAGARLLQTPPDMRGVQSAKRMMSSTRSLVDGVNVIDVMPPTPIRLFHVALRNHGALIAGGLEVESYHPGLQPMQHMSHTLRSVFLSLFPQVQQIGDFGVMRYPRSPEVTGQSAA